MLRSTTLLLAAAPLSLLVLAPAKARAGDQTTGIEVTVRPGYGSAGSGSPVTYAMPGNGGAALGPLYTGAALPYGGGFVGDLMLGYRPSRWMSLGLSGGTRTSSASTTAGAPGLTRSAMSAGIYLRAYTPVVYHLEGYLSVGGQYLHDQQTYSATFASTAGSLAGSVNLIHYGVAIPVTVGVNYRFLDYFAVGPSFQYTEVISADGCASGSAPGALTQTYCSGDPNPVTGSSGYGVWSLGLDVRATFL